METVMKRRFRSKAERRAIVLETLKPGASVARVALQHGINANQVFQWRRLYHDHRLDMPEPETALIPVTISTGIEKQPRRRESNQSVTGTIDIDLGHARVRIEGSADPECVRAALQSLAR